MKKCIRAVLCTAVVLLCNSTTQAQGTAFTYQGRLQVGGVPANGSYDFRWVTFDAGINGTGYGLPVTNTATPVSNGLFTLTVDLGNVFTGGPRWLDIGVRTNGGGAFTAITPRQQLTPAPYAMFAASAGNLNGTVPASQLSGALTVAQLPANVVTNGQGGLSLSGTFSGGFGALSNLSLSSSPNGSTTANRIRFTDTAGAEQIFVHAHRNLDFETENSASFWVGLDFSRNISRNVSESVGNNLNCTIGGQYYCLSGGDFLDQSYGSLALYAVSNLVFTAGENLTESIGLNQSTAVGNNLSLSVGNNVSISAGHNYSIIPGVGVGIGTTAPQSPLHVYSANNPTVVRVQSTGTPGFGRLEFVSNPQGDANEWRPAFIQSLDAGGFTGGLGFYVNGTGSGNKFSTNEVMRIQNGRVGIGTTAPSTLLQVGAATCNGTTWANGSDRNSKENIVAVAPLDVLAKVIGLPVSRWSYKSDQTSEHIGPMAQDFYAAFGVGADDKHIATVDADGVALAAIQGLNEKLESENQKAQTQLAELKSENATLKARLEKLERLLEQRSN